MWWECSDCVAGGNDDKSMNAHSKAFPSHKLSVVQDAILEDD